MKQICLLLLMFAVFNTEVHAQTIIVNPNPIDQRASLTIILDIDDTATVMVTDLIGKTAFTLYTNKFLKAGTTVDSLKMDFLLPGVYILSYRGKMTSNKGLKFIKSGPVGIEERFLETSLMVYPNPSSTGQDIFLRTINNVITEAEVSVVDLWGREIFRQEILLPATPQRIETDKLPAGSYVLKIKTKDGIVERKVVRE